MVCTGTLLYADLKQLTQPDATWHVVHVCLTVSLSRSCAQVSVVICAYAGSMLSD